MNEARFECKIRLLHQRQHIVTSHGCRRYLRLRLRCSRYAQSGGLRPFRAKGDRCNDQSVEHYFIVHKAIARPEDFKGKRVAVSGIGLASDMTTRMVLRFWKLNLEKDLTILASGNTPSRIAALTVGHVAAGLVSPDHVNRVLATGCSRILADRRNCQ